MGPAHDGVETLLPGAEWGRVSWDLRTPDLRLFGRQVARYLKPFRIVSAASGGYDAASFRRRLGWRDLILLRYGNAVTIDAGRLEGLPLLQVPLVGSYAVTHRGRTLEVPQRTAHLIPAGTPLVMDWSADCLLLVVRLEPRTPWAATHGALGSLARLDEPANRTLGHLLDFLLSDLIEDGPLAQSTQLAGSAEAMFRAALSDRFATRPAKARSDAVRRVEAALETIAADAAVDVDELALAAGTSRRTLYRQFRAAHGTTPAGWLRMLNLDRANAALANPPPSGCTVTDVALAHGFGHFGRFARDYRARFGERPSDTLRRAVLTHGPPQPPAPGRP